MKALAVVAGILTIAGTVTLTQFNRRLEAACALPAQVAYPPQFRRVPLSLELAYVTIGVTASVARAIRKALS